MKMLKPLRRSLQKRRAGGKTAEGFFDSEKSQTSIRTLWIRILAFIGMVLSLLLCLSAFNALPLEYCYADGQSVDCGTALDSRWATVFTVPVALVGTLVFAAIVYCTFGSNRMSEKRVFLQSLCMVAGLASIWFLYLQFFKSATFCLPCLIVNGCGITLMFRSLNLLESATRVGVTTNKKDTLSRRFYASLKTPFFGAMFAGLLLMIIGQVLDTQREVPTNRIASSTEAPESFSSTANSNSTDSLQKELKDVKRDVNLMDRAKKSLQKSTAVFKATESVNENPIDVAVEDKRISFDRKGVAFAIGQFPFLGDPEGENHAVFILDVACENSRQIFNALSDFLEVSNKQLTIHILPVSLDAAVNPHILATQAKCSGSESYAKLLIAVNQERPKKFEQVFQSIMRDKQILPLEDVLETTKQMLGSDDIDQWMNSESVRESLDLSLSIYEQIMAVPIPRLYVGNKIIQGKFKDRFRLFGIIDRGLRGE